MGDYTSSVDVGSTGFEYVISQALKLQGIWSRKAIYGDVTCKRAYIQIREHLYSIF